MFKRLGEQKSSLFSLKSISGDVITIHRFEDGPLTHRAFSVPSARL
jgi:hypothetical protein